MRPDFTDPVLSHNDHDMPVRSPDEFRERFAELPVVDKRDFMRKIIDRIECDGKNAHIFLRRFDNYGKEKTPQHDDCGANMNLSGISRMTQQMYLYRQPPMRFRQLVIALSNNMQPIKEIYHQPIRIQQNLFQKATGII